MKKLAPGVYEDGDELHIDLAEFVVAQGGDPNNPRDQATAERAIRQFAADEAIPDVEVRPRG